MNKRKRITANFSWVIGVLIAYILITVVVLAERSGISYNPLEAEVPYLDAANITLTQAPTRFKSTVLVVDPEQEESVMQADQWRFILDSMDVPYKEIDASKRTIGNLSAYDKIILTMPNITCVDEDLENIDAWVNAGGSLLLSATQELASGFFYLSQRLGIIEYGAIEYNVTEQLVFDDFMVGGNCKIPITDAYESSLQVRLTDDCIVHINDGTEHPVPILWEREYGDGRFVCVNLGFNEQITRGIYAAAFSLLGDAFVYPVVNSSTFYIDDFPSPVPQGNGEFIQAEFGRSISSFYTNVWWPDMKRFSQQYGIKYTGAIIENYEDEVNPPFERNPDTSRFSFFGKDLLQLGGELCYHGYNHMPLVLESFDYKGYEDYTKWPSTEAMAAAVAELRDFSHKIFGDNGLAVYVPPSNILSAEGRQVLVDTIPELKGIASLYFNDFVGYGQEIHIAADGVAEMPRIVSGAELTDYMKLGVISELNFHFYNSHFLHPDDLIDPDRGADKGWTYLKGTLESYISKLVADAPALRQQVSTEQVGAVQRYCYAEVDHAVTTEKITVDITNFFDEAYCLVRVREGAPGAVTGGSLEHLTSDLYLLRADAAHVEIELEGAA